MKYAYEARYGKEQLGYLGMMGMQWYKDQLGSVTQGENNTVTTALE